MGGRKSKMTPQQQQQAAAVPAAAVVAIKSVVETVQATPSDVKASLTNGTAEVRTSADSTLQNGSTKNIPQQTTDAKAEVRINCATSCKRANLRRTNVLVGLLVGSRTRSTSLRHSRIALA